MAFIVICHGILMKLKMALFRTSRLCLVWLSLVAIAVPGAWAQEDDDSVFIPPTWATPAVQRAQQSDYDGALRVLDQLAPSHASSYALPLLRAKVWGEKYFEADSEAQEIVALKQERKYLLQAKVLATGPQNRAIAAEIANDLTQGESLLRQLGVTLSVPPTLRPRSKAPVAAKRPIANRPISRRPASARPAPPRRIAARPPASTRMVKLSALKPRRGYVIGRATYPDGRPVSAFDVRVMGYDGQVNVFAGSTPSLGWGQGQNGRYAIRTTDTFKHKKPVAGLVVGVHAETKLQYRGGTYKMQLHPADGLRDGGNKGEFRGNSGPGVVRDFILKIQGGKPQFKQYDQSESSNSPDNGYHFYGATLALDLYVLEAGSAGPTLKESAPPGSTLVVTLVPQGALLDGSQGQTLRRTVRLGQVANYNFYLYNIPIGAYSATVDLITPDGSTWNLRSSTKRENYTRSSSFVFGPSSVLYGAETVRLYLVR